jgi:dTDP-4-amino-4,6-dideoxygalactose transaminase
MALYLLNPLVLANCLRKGESMVAQTNIKIDVSSGIPLNKPYMPSLLKYQSYINKMYDNVWLTNNGPLAQEFATRLREYLDVPFLVLTANGTAALQLAYNLYDLKGNVVTTPFSFIATSSSANWVGLETKFADIDPKSLNISPNLIEKAIDADTSAILPVHVYGNPCDTDAIDRLAQRYQLKTIYDAAHAFGIQKAGQSLLREGDASALSLHATKLFHCIEGGALVLKCKEDYEKAEKMINFGIDPATGAIPERGFNGKLSEAHAAMGLAMLDDIDHIIEKRCELYLCYQKYLGDNVAYPKWDPDANQTGAYFPIVLKNAKQTERVMSALSHEGIQSRRYFSPSLNTLRQFCSNGSVLCPNSERISKRVLCLPLFFDLNKHAIKRITYIIKRAL